MIHTPSNAVRSRSSAARPACDAGDVRSGRDGADLPPAGASAGNAGLAAATADGAPLRGHRHGERGRGRAKARLPPCRCSKAARSPGMVIIAHERGNCSAYNAGWQTALAAFPGFRHLLVIDDDEIADPDWLERMCASQRDASAPTSSAGRKCRFSPTAATSAAPAIRCSRRPTRESGPVAALYSSGNLLIGRHVLDAMGPPFLDLRFNFMGGGDSDFLSRAAQRVSSLPGAQRRRSARRCRRAGSKRTGSARAACATASSRRWSKRRSAPATPVGRSARLRQEPGAACCLAVPRLAPGWSEPARRRSAIYPVYVALGRVLAEFGYANEQYRQPEKN